MSTSSKIVKTLRDKKLDVSLLSDDDSPCIIKNWLSTGCLVLDAIMGGGLPEGRMIEVFGEYSSGKSLIASQAACMAQQVGMLVAYADTEGTVSLKMMQKLGVDVDNLIYAAPDTIEETFTFFEDVIDEKNRIDPTVSILIIWDSVSASSAKFEEEAEYGKATMGRHAKLISESMRKFVHKISKDGVYAMFLNQTRQKIGVMFGDSTTTSGGNAIGFYASIRVRLDLTNKLKAPTSRGKPRIVGMNTKASIIKNKVAMPFRWALLPIYFGNGIDDAKSTFLYLLENGLIEQNGISYKLVIGEDEYSFKKKQFDKFFDDNYDAIADIVMASEEEDGNIAEVIVDEE